MFAVKWLQKNKQEPVLRIDDVGIRISGGFTRSNNEQALISLESYNPVLLNEIIGQIDSKYFYSAIDCSEYEMQCVLAQNYRDQAALTERVEKLESQNDAVCRQLSHLILEKQPHYQRELLNVLYLQEVNSAAYEECIEARRSLEGLMRRVVEPRVIVIRNNKRRLRLKNILETLKRIQALYSGVKALNKVILERKFCEAISLHRKSCQITEDFKVYSCAESLQQSLRAVKLKIDDALDSALAESCENFSCESYALVQSAFERLGSTIMTVTQLQLHYTTKIHERAAKVLLEVCGAPFTDDAKNIVAFEKVCVRLPVEALVQGLFNLSKALWSILVCYHRTALWHENASQVTDAEGTNFTEEHECEKDPDVIHGPDIVRQWHGYVASKLRLNRGRVWMDVVSRVKPLLASIANSAKQLEFEEIVATLNIVNLLVQVGKEFAGHMSFDLLEVLKNSIRGFFVEFHRKHMERLRLFLDHESWQYVPVRPEFSLLDLREFNPLTEIFVSNVGKPTTEPGTYVSTSPNREKLLKEPYECKFFDLSLENCEEIDGRNSDDSKPLSSEASFNGDGFINNFDGAHDASLSGPILASTTIEVLRLLGRYIQMMRLLRPIASEVMHSIGQIFDYYLYVVYCLFGKSLASEEDTYQLPEHLRKTLTRISTRLIAPAEHPSVENGSRFVVPDCIRRVFNSQNETTDFNHLVTMDDVTNHLRRYLVGVQSLIYLAGVLEKDLLPHLREYLPESNRGLLDAFRDQSLVTTPEVLETTARYFVSHILAQLIVYSYPKRDSISTPSLLRQMISTNPGWISKIVATEPSAYLQSVNAAISRFSTVIKTTSQPTPPQPTVKVLWVAAMAWISSEILEGLSGVQDCSEEGRSQMLLDVQSTALLCETESGIRPFVRLNLLVDYIQAFFVPTREFSSWLESTGVHRYTQRQCLGLANCLSRGDKHARQRLTAMVTTAYSKFYQQTYTSSSGAVTNGIDLVT